MDTLRDYLNPARIYTVGVSDLEKTTPTVKDFLTTAEDCSGDEVAYCTPICSGRCCQNAPVRENLTTAESAEKWPIGQFSSPTDVLCSYCGKRMTVPAVDYRPGSYAYVCHDCANPFANGRQVKNGTGTEEIERGTIDLQVGTAKPGTETVPNCGTKPRQSAEWAAKGLCLNTTAIHVVGTARSVTMKGLREND